jgi:hypothetical protein
MMLLEPGGRLRQVQLAVMISIGSRRELPEAMAARA